MIQALLKWKLLIGAPVLSQTQEGIWRKKSQMPLFLVPKFPTMILKPEKCRIPNLFTGSLEFLSFFSGSLESSQVSGTACFYFCSLAETSPSTCSWPQVWFGVRFMLPMIPFVALFAVLGLRYLTALAFPKTKNSIYSSMQPWLFYASIHPNLLVSTSCKSRRRKSSPQLGQTNLKAGQWCGANLDKSAVISTRKAGLFYVNSQRKVCGFCILWRSRRCARITEWPRCYSCCNLNN